MNEKKYIYVILILFVMYTTNYQKSNIERSKIDQ